MSDERIGRYRILEALGAGGMGEVFLAEDPDLGRKVAIKVLNPTVASSEQARSRLRREARALAALNAPGIVIVHEVGVDDDRDYIVMEYVDGESLHDVRLEVDEAARVIRASALALDEAHEAGVLHRDVKPENLMLTDGGRVKVVDFGIARTDEGDRMSTPPGAESDEDGDAKLTQAGAIIGTPAYMAPELLDGAPASRASDVYALGLTFYELLTGDNPLDGGTIPETIRRIKAGDRLTPLDEKLKDAPLELARLVTRMTAPDPGARPTMREVATALENGAPSKAATRIDARLLAAMALGLAIVVGGAFAWMTPSAERPEPEVIPVAEETPPEPVAPVIAVPPVETELVSAGGTSDGAAYLLATMLRGVPELRVVTIQDLRGAIAARTTGTPDWALAANTLGATHMVHATIEERDELLVATGRLVDTSSGGDVVDVTVRSEDLDGLLVELALALARGVVPDAEISAERRHTLASLDHYELGSRALRRRDWAGAVVHLERAVEEEPEFFEAWYHLALARSWAPSPLPEITAASRRAMELAATPRDRAMTEGLLGYFEYRYDDAIGTLRPIYEENPRDRDVGYILAEALYHSGRHAEGIERFRQVLRSAPAFTLAAIHPLGYAIAQRDEETAVSLEALLRNEDTGTRYLGEIHFAMGRYEEAASDEMPADVRSSALLVLGRTAEADALVEASHDGSSQELWLYRSARAYADGDAAGASRAVRRLTALTQEHANPISWWSMRTLMEIVVAAEATADVRALAELALAESEGVTLWRIAVHSGPFLEGDPPLRETPMPFWYQRSAEAIDLELEGRHAEAAAAWRGLLEDPSETGDFLEWIALRRNLLALGETEEAGEICERLARPARFHPVMIVMRAKCAPADGGAP